MISIEKILKVVDKNIIETINRLVKDENKEQLNKWLKECKQEIQRRESEKQNCYNLYAEMYYLESVIKPWSQVRSTNKKLKKKKTEKTEKNTKNITKI